MQEMRLAAKRKTTNADLETDGLIDKIRRETRQKGGDHAIFTDT